MHSTIRVMRVKEKAGSGRLVSRRLIVKRLGWQKGAYLRPHVSRSLPLCKVFSLYIGLGYMRVFRT